MSYHGSIQVQDPSGWTKTFPLEKALVMVGSAPVNDILLPEEQGEGVLPVHLQLLHTRLELENVRAVNLSDIPIPVQRANPAGVSAISPHAYQDLEDGDALQVGGFELVFSLQSSEGFSHSSRSEHLGLKLETPGLALKASRQLDGLLTVINYGTQKRCQFGIDLEGLPPDCYQIDPAPLLYPNGEAQLRVRIYHRGSRPPAGSCAVCLRMTAPGAYPTEEVRLPFSLEVAPVYQVDVCVLERKGDPFSWMEAASAPEPAAATPVEPVDNQPQKSTEVNQEAAQPTRQEAAKVPLPPVPSPVHDEEAGQELPQAPAPSPSAAPAGEQDQDWWSETRAAQIPLQASDPYARRNPGRKPRPSPGQVTQVLHTPETPVVGSATQLPDHQTEDSEQNE
jgi:hypothetical protein